jgi:hypothetical protein
LGIAFDQSFRNFLAADFRGGIASGGEHWNALLGVVSIGGQHVDGVVFDQPVAARRTRSPQNPVRAEPVIWITQPCSAHSTTRCGLSRRIGLRSG